MDKNHRLKPTLTFGGQARIAQPTYTTRFNRTKCDSSLHYRGLVRQIRLTPILRPTVPWVGKINMTQACIAVVWSHKHDSSRDLVGQTQLKPTLGVVWADKRDSSLHYRGLVRLTNTTQAYTKMVLSDKQTASQHFCGPARLTSTWVKSPPHWCRESAGQPWPSRDCNIYMHGQRGLAHRTKASEVTGRTGSAPNAPSTCSVPECWAMPTCHQPVPRDHQPVPAATEPSQPRRGRHGELYSSSSSAPPHHPPPYPRPRKSPPLKN